jgi:CheY-like chemotaxis protein
MNKLNLESECAVNGLEALQKYQAAPSRYFLVLMDMNMPVRSCFLSTSCLITIQIMDGFESTAKIRDHERTCGLPRVNIAALTGVTSSEARARAKDAGVNVYVTKPIRMKDLTTMISDIQAGKPST